MPTIKFNCPSCGKQWTVYVDKSTSFVCSVCSVRIKPKEDGTTEILLEPVIEPEDDGITEIFAEQVIKTESSPKVTPETENNYNTVKTPIKDETLNPRTIARNVVNPEFRNQTSEPNPAPNQDPISSPWLILIGVLMVAGYYVWNDVLKPINETKSASFTNEPASKPSQTSSPSPSYQTPSYNSQQAPDQTNTSSIDTSTTSNNDIIPKSSNEVTIDNNAIYKTYYGRYTFDNENVPQIDNFKLTISQNQIRYEKDGVIATFDIEYQGTFTREPQPGLKFLYHKFYLTNEKRYIVISDRKEVYHENVYYYRLIVDGQTQLAL